MICPDEYRNLLPGIYVSVCSYFYGMYRVNQSFRPALPLRGQNTRELWSNPGTRYMYTAAVLEEAIKEPGHGEEYLRPKCATITGDHSK